jgi:hypothetical protein
MQKLKLIIEKGDGEWWGRIEDKGNYLPVTVANSIEEVISNMRMLIQDYLENEGREDKFWGKIDPEKVVFEIRYDSQAFFEELVALKISSIAKRAGLNESLLRQYATGKKYPSAEQVKKLEDAVHQLGAELQKVSIYA